MKIQSRFNRFSLLRLVWLCGAVSLLFVGCYYDLEDDDDASESPNPTATPRADADSDGYVAADDCDDHNPDVHPGAQESCNGLDDDCDGAVDNGLATTDYFTDQDADGYGAGTAIPRCGDPEADEVIQDGDCDDTNADINPEATEQCNGLDDDCNGTADDGLPTDTYYADLDRDGYGAGEALAYCGAIDPGIVAQDGDCDDSNADIYPGAEEQCNDLDDDCDGETDDADALEFSDYYIDADGDGWGAETSSIEACAAPEGYATDAGDCNDGDATIHPGVQDICDNVDNDCDEGQPDGGIDEDPDIYYHQDQDHDGYGAADSSTASCQMPPDTAENDRDCDDSTDAVSPAAEEIPDNDVDDNCDGLVDLEVDVYVTADGASPVDSGDAAVLTSIQEAINVAYAGQIIAVGPGTYFEHINFQGKDVTVVSLQGAETTIIDGEGREDDQAEQDSVVLFINGEGAGAILRGFTITGGKGTDGDICGYEPGIGTRYGGGICTRSASPTIEDNIIENNDVWGSGAGLYLALGSVNVRNNIIRWNSAGYDAAGINLSQSAGNITGNVIVENQAGRDGAGLYAYESSPLIANNIIAFNVSEDLTGKVVASGHGAGVCLYDSYPPFSNNIVAYNTIKDPNGGGIYVGNTLSGATLTNNTIVGNEALESGGGLFIVSGEVLAINNIVAFNKAPNGANVVVNTTVPEGALSSSYNLYYVGESQSGMVGDQPEASDLIGNPGFVDDPLDLVSTDDDYHLAEGSIAIDAGNPDARYEDADGSPGDLGAFGGPWGDDFEITTMAEVESWLE